MSRSESSFDADAVVVGGGPAGSSAAGSLASRGRRVVLVERERFPRFHIGESLLPECHRIFAHLGVTARLEAERLPLKRGAFLISPGGEGVSYADFSSPRGLLRPAAWEVSRERFDQILLERAAELGAEVRMLCRATAVRFDPAGVEVDVRDAAGEHTLRAKVLIDASGRDGFLAKRFGLRQIDEELRQIGIHAWFEDVVPPPAGHEGDIRLVSRYDGGWSWVIPLPGGRTSVGVVVPVEVWRQHSAANSEARAEAAFEALTSSMPPLAEMLAPARRVTEVRVDADYSYQTKAYSGDRWLLAGDAGSFLDPIFSSGVQLALEGGINAAEAVDRGLARGDFRRAFARHDRRQAKAYGIFRRFVLGFYDGAAMRDLLMTDGDPMGMRTAVTTILAGVTRPRFSVRWRLRLFFFMVRMHERRALVPRVHLPPSERADAA